MVDPICCFQKIQSRRHFARPSKLICRRPAFQRPRRFSSHWANVQRMNGGSHSGISDHLLGTISAWCLEHEFYNFPYIGNSNPTDFHIFQRGWNMLKPPNQIWWPLNFSEPIEAHHAIKILDSRSSLGILGMGIEGGQGLAWTTNAKWAEVLKLSPGLFCFHPRNLT